MKRFKQMLLKVIIGVAAILSITLLAVAAYLYFNQSLTAAAYSDGIFVVSIVYMFIGIIPAYSVITTSNDISIRAGEYMVKGRIDPSDRVIDSKRSFKSLFPLVMFTTALLCMAASALIGILN